MGRLRIVNENQMADADSRKHMAERKSREQSLEGLIPGYEGYQLPSTNLSRTLKPVYSTLAGHPTVAQCLSRWFGRQATSPTRHSRVVRPGREED
jgi:hypothetical protein